MDCPIKDSVSVGSYIFKYECKERFNCKALKEYEQKNNSNYSGSSSNYSGSSSNYSSNSETTMDWLGHERPVSKKLPNRDW